jgi:DNA repair exonuclease SbcCD ATPase subunit
VDLHDSRLADGKQFYCPNGDFVGWGDNELKRLKRDVKWQSDRAAAALARADQAEASLRTTKGHVTRLRKRVTEGQCPFCGQHLRDLERHVARQHAGQDREEGAES